MKHIQFGIGFDDNDNPYDCAKQACTTALSQIKGRRPKLTLIFYAGEYDVNEINRALKEHLKGTEFIGGSTDAVIYKDNLFPKGIVVTCIFSDYIHVGIASAENITKDPYNLSYRVAQKAVNKLSIDKYLDSYMLFSRMKKGDLSQLIRIPSFFSFVFTRGHQIKNNGNEDLIIKGIADATGNYIPTFGGSLGNDMDKIFSNTPYEINTFHSGKILKDGLVVAFVSTGLMYSSSIAHGAHAMNKIGYISKVRNKGFVVSEICNQPVAKWYAKQLGITEKKFWEKELYYTQKHPLGFPDGYGNIIMRAGGAPYGKSLAYIAPFKPNTPVFIMDIGTDKTLFKATKEIKDDVKKHLGVETKPFSTFLVSCSSRRRVLNDKKIKKELKEIQKNSELPLWGFFSFGEIGSKPAEVVHFHHLTMNVFNFYDKLMSE